jgi:hypothetical protein
VVVNEEKKDKKEYAVESRAGGGQGDAPSKASLAGRAADLPRRPPQAIL